MLGWLEFIEASVLLVYVAGLGFAIGIDNGCMRH